MFTNFGRFIKMALIVLRVLIAIYYFKLSVSLTETAVTGARVTRR